MIKYVPLPPDHQWTFFETDFCTKCWNLLLYLINNGMGNGQQSQLSNLINQQGIFSLLHGNEDQANLKPYTLVKYENKDHILAIYAMFPPPVCSNSLLQFKCNSGLPTTETVAFISSAECLNDIFSPCVVWYNVPIISQVFWLLYRSSMNSTRSLKILALRDWLGGLLPKLLAPSLVANKGAWNMPPVNQRKAFRYLHVAMISLYERDKLEIFMVGNYLDFSTLPQLCRTGHKLRNLTQYPIISLPVLILLCTKPLQSDSLAHVVHRAGFRTHPAKYFCFPLLPSFSSLA